MSATYRLDLKSPAGVKFAEVTNFDWLSCTVRVNAAGMLTAQLKGGHEAISSLENRSQVELYRKDDDKGIDWYRFFTGFYLWQFREQPDVSNFVLRAPGKNTLLDWRIVNYYTGYTSRSAFTSDPAETIMKSLVTYNITSSATTGNGRKRNGTNWPATIISVESDGAHGNSVDWFCHGDNLLDTLNKLARIAGGDFDLVKTGANAFEFRWYTGQLGTDRSSSVEFSVEKGNMGSPEYTYDRLDEKTVACVWGQNEGAQRDYATRTGDDYAATNDREMYVNAKDVDTSAGYNARGDQKLDEARAREEFQFKVLQRPKSYFDEHYFLGDLVTVVNPFTGVSATQKIKAATLGLDQDGNESIDVEVGTA